MGCRGLDSNQVNVLLVTPHLNFCRDFCSILCKVPFKHAQQSVALGGRFLKTDKMTEKDSRSLASGIAGTVIILFLTLPSVIGILSHLRSSKPKPRIYEDKDGVATEESMAKYSAKLPKIFLVVFVALGLCTSTALAILGTLGSPTPTLLEDWLNAAQWVRTRDAFNIMLTLCSSLFLFKPLAY